MRQYRVPAASTTKVRICTSARREGHRRVHETREVFLIKANKRFDMIIVPGSRHGIGGEWWNWTRAKYFCKHLLGEARDDADMVEVTRELTQRGDRGRTPDDDGVIKK